METNGQGGLSQDVHKGMLPAVGSTSCMCLQSVSLVLLHHPHTSTLPAHNPLIHPQIITRPHSLSTHVALPAPLTLPCPFPVPQRCAKWLRPGGRIAIEDYAQAAPDSLTEKEQEMLKVDVAVPQGRLPSIEEYREHLEAAGFTDVEVVDMTPRSREFVEERLGLFKDSYDKSSATFGEDLASSLLHFYNSVVSLFQVRGGTAQGVPGGMCGRKQPPLWM